MVVPFGDKQFVTENSPVQTQLYYNILCDSSGAIEGSVAL